MPKIDVTALPFVVRGGYPPPHDKLVAGRSRKRLGDEAGLTQFGVNLTMLTPGAFSSLRHWHENQDEFVFLIEGELTLIEDEGETVLRPGDGGRLQGRRCQRPPSGQPLQQRCRLSRDRNAHAARTRALFRR